MEIGTEKYNTQNNRQNKNEIYNHKKIEIEKKEN
jgi:hypothetical protein